MPPPEEYKTVKSGVSLRCARSILVHTSHYSRLKKPTTPLATQKRLPRVYYTWYLSLRIRTSDSSPWEKTREKLWVFDTGLILTTQNHESTGNAPPLAPQAAWDDSDTLLQLPGIRPTQASRLRSKGVSTLRDLALRGETSAKKLLESCGLAPQGSGAAGGRTRGGGSRGGDVEGNGGVGAALRALSAIPVVKDAVFEVHPAGEGGRKGVSTPRVL